MGGRPQVTGLIAVAVASWFASQVAAPPAVAELRVPIPGLFVKEKPVKPKRHVRPTLPSRNPTRVTARVSASAVSPPQAKDSEVAAAAGAQSSASVSLALPRAPERPDKTAEASAEARSSSVAGAAAPAETAQADPSEATAPPTTGTASPNHDASVVLNVAPPPEDRSAAKGQTVEDHAAETDIATLTPPSVPAEDENPQSADSSPTAPKASDAGAEPASDSNAEETQVPDDADASGEAAEAAEEPAPPPAHPVVAQVREKLEDPGLRKTAAASDLKALKEFYGAYEGAPLWVTDDGFTAKAQELIAEIGKADEWGLKASSFDLPSADDRPATPDAMADDELQLSVALLGYARQAQIGRLSPRSVSELFDQHPSLRDPKIVLREIAAADKSSAYLLTLHPQHEQFKRLHKALAKARENAELAGRDPRTDRDVQLITINMERWRWLPRSLGNYHVWNNVPEFNVRVKKGGRTIYQEKTIVGQYKYATPLFSAKMRNIVFHPNWTVPPTIVKEDIAPKLQGAGGGGFFNNSKEAILRRYGLKASFKGEPINADTVDWNNVNVQSYTFTQDPGPANVLGKFKFNFPNKHAIYMHDTVQRELFAQTNRTLSHGCIRVNQPDRFATLLLSQDKGWTASQVDNLVAQNESKVVPLNRPVPVHLTYFTAVVDEYGTLNRFGDIYGIDNIMASKLFRNPTGFSAPASASFVELDSHTQTRPRRRGGGGFDNFISGLFGN
jgi:murein L,D-transpeptidase YcbB/YkuD